eukprot:1179381-Prorocentrum_minimum.AAC.9
MKGGPTREMWAVLPLTALGSRARASCATTWSGFSASTLRRSKRWQKARSDEARLLIACTGQAPKALRCCVVARTGKAPYPQLDYMTESARRMGRGLNKWAISGPKCSFIRKISRSGARECQTPGSRKSPRLFTCLFV